MNNDQTKQLLLIIGQLILQYGPTFVQSIIKVVHKTDPTLEDWMQALDLAKNPIASVDPAGNIIVPPVGS